MTMQPGSREAWQAAVAAQIERDGPDGPRFEAMTVYISPEMALLPLYDRRMNVVGHTSVDDDMLDWCNQWTWRLHKAPSQKLYAVRNTKVNGRSRPIFLHRELLGLPHSSGGIEVDHINGNGLHNQRANLRSVTHAQNLQNKRSYTGASSPYRGVHWSSRYQKWVAKARLAGKETHLGYFTDEQEAAAVASAWRKEHMPFAVEAAS